MAIARKSGLISVMTIVLLATFFVTARADDALPRQPKLGFEGHLVDVSKYLPAGLTARRDRRAWGCWSIRLNANRRPGRWASKKATSSFLSTLGDSTPSKDIAMPCGRPDNARRSSSSTRVRRNWFAARATCPTSSHPKKDKAPQKPDSYQMGITLEEDVSRIAPDALPLSDRSFVRASRVPST